MPLRLAVLGDPISHSRSPAIHGAAMRHLGIDGTYEARRAGPAELATAIRELQDGALHGMNITMPLKAEAANAAGSLTDEAQTSGSVNSLRLSDGVVEGHSTDVIASLSVFAQPRFDTNAPILILGSGGAAAAALVGARGHVAYLSARNMTRATSLVERTGSEANVVPWGTAIVGALLVNATPLGMHGEQLPMAQVEVAAGIIDLAYGDLPTPAIVRAEASGVAMMDGVEFLALQAASSFEWWTGMEAPFEIMLESARKA
jgi:shikimate dehydrogenase